MAEARERINLDALSDDAKALAGVWFGLMGPKSNLTLHLRENVPAPRTKAALDELVSNGVLSVEQFNQYGGLLYRPLVDCHDAFKWQARLFVAGKGDHINWQLMEPLTPKDQKHDR